MSTLLDRRAARGALIAGGAFLIAVLLSSCGFSSDDDAQTMKRVGLMHVGTDHIPSSWPALKARLAELGWKDGENVELIWRNLESKQAEPQAQAFVRDGVDVIVAFEDTSIDAAQKATTSRDVVRTGDPIPIVFLHPTDPVRDGLVKTLAYPDTNLTGVYGARDEVDKQLEIYQRLVPGLRRMLTLVDPTDPRTERLLPGYREAARQLARPIELDIREASSEKDLARIFRSLRPGEVDAAFLLSPNLRLNHSAATIRLARQARLPVQAHRKEWVKQGALFSYGIDLPLIGRTGARYVDSLLDGMSPAELPVEEVPKIEFAINLKTARRLGIKVPQEIVITADEVYR